MPYALTQLREVIASWIKVAGAAFV